MENDEIKMVSDQFLKINEEVAKSLLEKIKTKSETYDYSFHRSCFAMGEKYAIGIIFEKLYVISALYKNKDVNENKIKKLIEDVANYCILLLNYYDYKVFHKALIEAEECNSEEVVFTDKRDFDAFALDPYAIKEAILKSWIEDFAGVKEYIENIECRFIKDGYVVCYRSLVVFSVYKNTFLLNNYLIDFDNNLMKEFYNKLKISKIEDINKSVYNINMLLSKLGTDYEHLEQLKY